MNERPILKNKFYLYLTEFFSGVSVMAVELGASRLLAPYFSSSQIVWTIIIGTIMIAMALGNLWGGKNADKDPNPDKLYKRLLIAAVWIAAIPFLGRYIIIGITGLLVLAISTNLLIIAAFASCMVIFVFPLFLLGTVTPSLVKYTVDSLSDNGKTVGTLGAANTIGSIIGTFLPTFVTIPAVGTSVTFLLFSGILLAIGIIYFLSGKSGKKACVISVFAFIIFSFCGHKSSFAFWDKTLSYEGESVYNYLQVKDYSDRTVLSTNVIFGVQSVKMKKDGLTGMYYDYAMAAPVMAGISQKKDADILVLGNGTGTYASQCRKYFPNAKVTGVEIDKKITGLAGEYFGMPKDTDVCEYDGRAYIQETKEKYDVIFVDAYQDITIPFQMSSKEFFTLVYEHLKDGGVMVMNMNMHSDGKGSINQALSDTVSSVFGTVYTADVPSNTNRELFAGKKLNIPSSFKDNIKNTEGELGTMAENISDGLTKYEPQNMLLTDDKAPVEVMGMKLLDTYISQELSYYRSVFKENGIKGLINEING